MAISISVMAIVTSLHLIAFVLAIGAESRRSTGKVVPDEYDERTFCVYDSDASTTYGLTASGLLLISQVLINAVTRCLCFGRGLVMTNNGGSSGGGGSKHISTSAAVIFFVVSWTGFLGAEACLLAGSARNAYHTKYRGWFHAGDFSCATLRKGVFAAGAGLALVSMVGSILYYWFHTKADTGGWQKHRNEGLGMMSNNHTSQGEEHEQQHNTIKE